MQREPNGQSLIITEPVSFCEESATGSMETAYYQRGEVSPLGVRRFVFRLWSAARGKMLTMKTTRLPSRAPLRGDGSAAMPTTPSRRRAGGERRERTFRTPVRFAADRYAQRNDPPVRIGAPVIAEGLNCPLACLKRLIDSRAGIVHHGRHDDFVSAPLRRHSAAWFPPASGSCVLPISSKEFYCQPTVGTVVNWPVCSGGFHNSSGIVFKL